MNELVDFLVKFAIIYFIVKVGLNIIDSWFDEKKTQVDTIKKQLHDIIHEVKIEQRDSVSYWFDAHTDQFLAQGTTREEIITALKCRFKQHIFIIDDGYLLGPDYTLHKNLNDEVLKGFFDKQFNV